MQKELFFRYVKNQCTPEELDIVLKWFEDTAGTIKGSVFLKQIWNEMDGLEEDGMIDYDRILDKVHHNLNISGSGKTLGQTTQGPSMKDRKNSIMRFLTKAAAVLFIPLLSLSIYTYVYDSCPLPGLSESHPVYTEIVSPYGSTISVDLPDGSKAWLNNGTSLKFPQKFTGRTRKVELSGEAFFHVAHNTKKPFLVTGSQIQVLATGTEFNLMAYPDEQSIETTLKSGKVILQKVCHDGKISTVFEMEPNQHAIYIKKDNKIIYRSENPDKYISWMNGTLIFRDDPMDKVIKKLGRWYNVDIRVDDPGLSEFAYTATFVDETLSQVLELLKIATPIDYTISTRVKQDDGTFSKREVIISLKKN